MGTWGRARKETTSGRAASVEGPGLGVGSASRTAVKTQVPSQGLYIFHSLE